MKSRFDAGIPPKLKNLVRDSIQRHAWNIGVSHFQGDVLYAKHPKDSDHCSSVCHADTGTDRRYLRATFTFYPVFVERWRREGAAYVERVVAHEVAHLATQHFYDVATARYCDDGEMKDAWEACTEVIGRLSCKLDEQLQERAARHASRS